jgi:transcriptional regulator with GAF, ATPase, and Fis domain
VALYAKGALLPSMRYPLSDTPCENVMGKALCYYPHGVQALFPADLLLAEMGVESYAGVPLWDSGGGALGLIAVMDSKPFCEGSSLTNILQLVATSAAAALEREFAEKELRTLNEQLEQRVRERTVELAAKNVELEKMNRLFVGRELRMVELKERIRALEGDMP